MADIKPFTGVFINKDRVKPEAVFTEPYDKISPALRETYLSRSPYNLVRIILGKDEPGDTDSCNKYTRAKALYEQWLAEGVLSKGTAPAVFVHEQEFTPPGGTGSYRRLGIIARVKASPFDQGEILPHEHTLSKPKADRLALLRTTQVHFEQIFLLYPSASPVQAGAGRELLAYQDDLGVTHRFAAIEDPAEIERICSAIGANTLYIADGHHRYETALAFSQEQRENCTHRGNPEASDYLTASFVSMEDPGLVVLPTHRAVANLEAFDEKAILAKLEKAFTVTPAQCVASALGSSGQRGVFGLVAPSGFYHLALKAGAGPASEFSHCPPLWETLDVSILQVLILDKVLGIDDEKLRQESNLTYWRSAEEAAALVPAGKAQLVFLLHPTGVQQVKTVSDARSRMPQKSTDFFPKLATGIVAYGLDSN